MPSTQIQLRPVSDEDLIGAWERLLRSIDPNANSQLDVMVMNGGQGTTVPSSQLRTSLNDLIEAGSSLLFQINLTVPISVAGRTTNVSFMSRAADNSNPGYLKIDIPTESSNSLDARRLLIAAASAFRDLARANLPHDLDTTLRDTYELRDSTLRRLEAAFERNFLETDKFRRELLERADGDRRRVEERGDELRRRLESEYQGKLEALNAKQTSLQERERELDLLDNTQARRNLHKSQKETLVQRASTFRLTRDTEAKHRWVLIPFTFLLAGTSAALAVSLFNLYGSGGEDWMLNLRAFLSLMSFLGSAIYLIRWQDRWAQSHAEEEFRLKRLDLDTDRASWLVEMILEWRTATGSDLPPDLLGRLANGLFEQGSPGRQAINHPAEDAAMAMAHFASKMRLNLPGVGEIELDKQGLRKIAGASDRQKSEG